jgi:hypothetical protein
MSDELLPIERMGYSIRNEDREYLEDVGEQQSLLMKAFQDSFPVWNATADPLGCIDVVTQGNQGSCQGQSIALVFSICYFLATARRQSFSAACGYYLSQKYDGIRGDNGSTLSGGAKVATQHGMCLESDWPYPAQYNPREPANVPYLFKLKATKPMRTVGDCKEWLSLGLPIQQGSKWNNSCSKEVVDNWQPMRGSGGHSTTFWQLSNLSNVKNINSWGKGWNGDGVHEFTFLSISRMLQDPDTVLIGYSPDAMSFPTPEPIGL